MLKILGNFKRFSTVK